MSWLYETHIRQMEKGGIHVVLIRNRFTNKIVTLGTFYGRHAAANWAKDAIARKAWRDASELPDDFDRGHYRPGAGAPDTVPQSETSNG